MKQSRTPFVKVAQALIEEAKGRVALGLAAPTLPRDYQWRLHTYCIPFFGKPMMYDLNVPVGLLDRA